MTPDEALRFFSEKKTAYQLTFGSPAGKAVLEDLERFCFAHESTILGRINDPVDLYRTFAVQGRREAYLRVEGFLKLTPEELVERYQRTSIVLRPATEGAISHD